MFVEVLVEITNKHVDKTFTYRVPDCLQEFIQVGIRVEVPFQNRMLEGFILKIRDDEPEYSVKDISRVVDSEVILTEELLELGKYLQKITLSSLMTCYQTMLPKALKAKKNVHISKKYETYLKLVDTSYVPKTEKQELVLSMFKDGMCLKKDVSKISPSIVKTFLEKNVLVEFQEEVYRYQREGVKKSSISLTPDQKSAVSSLMSSSYLVNLLHGVTGSGKTEVYMECIEETLSLGKTVIVLVPEISLTEQIVSRFLTRFSRIAVLHSKLSDGEKYDEYRRIAKGEVDIVIGARSAIFSPLKNLGLIIIDEEQSSSFKQDNNPRYRALDIAVYRAEKNNGKVILGSATPSLEVYARCLRKVYGLVELKKRVHERKMPEVITIDMNDEVRYGNRLFSRVLQEKIASHLDKKRQVLLLLNRRGYASFITCKNCGYSVKCPHCDITLTYHKSSGSLRCHYCGYSESYKRICPSCKEESLMPLGTGTEKVEENLEALFPNARVLRMDLDTTSKKGAHEKMISAFQNHEYDILLGTQIVAKGLDFPDVSLVGVINADTSLNIPDFRSSEDTFQLLCQVAGRSGRGEVEGEVVIQTFNPDHYAIEYAKKHDYLGFFGQEMQFRKRLGYPPYYYLNAIFISSPKQELCYQEGRHIADFLKKQLSSATVLGPTISGVGKINNIYRYMIIIKYKKEDKLYGILKYLDDHYKTKSSVKIDIDFYPSHF